jgi:hypothetical protein
MRRKAEILKYNNNTSSTKTNNLTKKEKYTQLIKGYSQKQSFQSNTITVLDKSGKYTTFTVGYPDKLIVANTNSTDPNAVTIVGSKGYYIVSIIPNGLLINCSKDGLIPTPTSACGVPGPIVNLIDDETVPVYNLLNYSISDAPYSESQTLTKLLWEIRTLPNILLPINVSNNIGLMIINKIIDQPTYTFTLKIPFGIYAKNVTGRTGSANIFINRINFLVYYSNSPIAYEQFNVSLLQYSLSSSINVRYQQLRTPVNGYNYFAYVDTVVVSGIYLYTNPGYVYDFYLQMNLDTTNSTYTSGFTNNVLVANYNNSIENSELTISS